MKRYVLPYLLALVGILLPVLPAQAAAPVYAGNLQVVNGANLSFLSGGSGCLLVQNGVAYIAACPVGTVAFSAASPFTVTGTGPYVIGCPTCFTTSGGTVTGATSFSNGITVTGNSSFASPLAAGTAATTAYTLIGGVSQITNKNANTPLALQFANNSSSTSSTYIGSNSVNTVQSYPCNVLAIGNYGFAPDICVDNAGHVSTGDSIYAANFFVPSKRAYKYDIQPLSVDALQVLHDADLATFRYRPGHGDPRLPHVGIIADDSPSILSGEKHDHLDIEALATVDAKAILQLDTQIQVLYVILGALMLLVIALVAVLGLVWHEKQFD